MSVIMDQEQVRLVLQSDSVVRDALRLAAAELRMEMSELADAILREALAEWIDRLNNPQERPKGKTPRK